MALSSKSDKYVLGMDLGTTSVKVVLLETQSKEVTDSYSLPTRADSTSTVKHAKEQDLDKIIETLNRCVAALPREKLQNVIKIGVSGQMHGVMFWKATGCRWGRGDAGHMFWPKDTSRLVTWQDGRCSTDFLHSLPRPDSHISVATGFGCATIFWYLRHRPEFLARFAVAGTVHDYVVAMLCGLDKCLMSTQNAASWGYFNTHSHQWNLDMAELLRVAWDPCTHPLLNISTSAQLSFAMPDSFQPPKTPASSSPISYFPYFNGSYLAVAASLNGGNVMATFVEMLTGWMKELGITDVSDSTIYSKLVKAALDQGGSDLKVRPTILGERHNTSCFGQVSNISASNLSLGHVTRALCCGIMGNVVSMLPPQTLLESGVKQIRGSGSALARNEVLRQEAEKVFTLPVLYGKDVDSAVGVAMIANDRM
ncbi:hypothetical protein JZ751_022439 [Albula glossodonta]|uniref:Sedoheptulokinase n=1 Tax=Albula glossodonta TaxID=121402 RepID=A0A8T2NGP1_9TELE|nr:hypothetical protein JZ751_022439 [Albula glossodonta]